MVRIMIRFYLLRPAPDDLARATGNFARYCIESRFKARKGNNCEQIQNL